MRAVKNAIEDGYYYDLMGILLNNVFIILGSIIPGGGAFEVAAYVALTSSEFLSTVSGRAKNGVKVTPTLSFLIT